MPKQRKKTDLLEYRDYDLLPPLSEEELKKGEAYLPGTIQNISQPAQSTSKLSSDDMFVNFLMESRKTNEAQRKRDEERLKRLQIANLIGQGIKTVGDVYGLSQGGPVQRRKEPDFYNNYYNQLTNNYNRLDQNLNNMMLRYLMSQQNIGARTEGNIEKERVKGDERRKTEDLKARLRTPKEGDKDWKEYTFYQKQYGNADQEGKTYLDNLAKEKGWTFVGQKDKESKPTAAQINKADFFRVKDVNTNKNYTLAESDFYKILNNIRYDNSVSSEDRKQAFDFAKMDLQFADNNQLTALKLLVDNYWNKYYKIHDGDLVPKEYEPENTQDNSPKKSKYDF